MTISHPIPPVVLMRPPSPSPSASGSINGFTFEVGTTSSPLISTAPRSRPNFWDFEAYSRAFLHEKKAIEREVIITWLILTYNVLFSHNNALSIYQLIHSLSLL